MSDQAAPPIRDLFSVAEDHRQKAVRYWIKDTLIGVLRLWIHELLRLLPTSWCSAIGTPLSRFTRRLYPRSEQRARRLWRWLYPDTTQAAEDQAIETLWRGVNRTMLEYSVLDRLNPSGRVTVIGKNYLDEAREQRKPRLIAGLHLGNWEVIGATLCAIDHPGSGFYEPPPNRFDHAIANRVRTRYGAKIVFPKHSAGRTAFRHLQSSEEVFLIYLDEVFRGQISAPAFGRPLKLEGNIAHTARLARLTDAAIIPAYCVRLGDAAQFKLTFLPPVPVIKTDDKDRDLEQQVAMLNEVIEPIIKAHMDQWYYAFDFEFNQR